MIIEGISMKNFQCYFGEHSDNFLKFGRGVNLILGNNGGGKSKLFDAFYWVIYDQVFQSDDRQFIATSVYQDKLISDKAKLRCEEGESVSAEVVLHVTDSQSNRYRITRIYRAKKAADRQWLSDKKSTLLIEHIKNKSAQLVPTTKYEPILERVLPGHLKPYMWFQGEQVDSLMDFKNRSSLMQTVNLLSEIAQYDRLIEITTSGEKKAASALSKARRDNSNNEQESERLAKAETRHKREIESLSNKIDEYTANISTANDAIEELVGQVADAERRIKLKADKKTADAELFRAEKELEDRLKGLSKKLFSEYWILKNVKPSSEKFENNYRRYSKLHLEKRAESEPAVLKLPVDMPHPVHIKDMIEARECFVCGRPAEEGSEALEHIERLLKRGTPKTESIFTNDCSEFFERLYNNNLKFGHYVDNLDEKIKTEFKQINALRARVSAAAEAARVVDSAIDELLSDDNSSNIVGEFRQHESNRERNTHLCKLAERDLEKEQAGLEHVQKAQNKLVKGKIQEAVELGATVWKDLLKLSQSTRSSVFENLVADLESSANQIYREMTALNQSFTGRLRLRISHPDKISAEIVDNEDIVIAGSNDSNIILVKLALIMAILKSRPLWSQNYCMVTDAPTAKMASEYSRGFYEALKDNFAQSIVMTYDFLKPDEAKDLLALKPCKVYRLEAQYPAGNREDRADLSVKISEVAL